MRRARRGRLRRARERAPADDLSAVDQSAERAQRGAGPVAGSLPARLPHHSHIPGHSSLRTWIYRIVVNQARNRQRWWRRRHRAQQVSLDQHIQDHGELPETHDRGPDRLVGQKQLAEKIRTALDRLPFDQKTAIVLREIDGLSYDEIGFSLGIAVGTVKSRLARAREGLRAQLRDV